MHNRPTLGIEEQNAAERVLTSGWLAQGREIDAFEKEFCAYLGIPDGHAVALSSGSAALFLALHVLGAKNQKVTCPVYSCSALPNAIAFAGGVPHLVDTVQGSPNVDAASLGASIAPFAIVPHMFGIPADLSAIQSNQAFLIEDFAQALGIPFPDGGVGQSRVAVFSFYATKMITSGGQGGMLVAWERGIAEAARDYREFDCRDDRKYRFNFQMTDLQAAIGREQLKKLPEFVARREEIFIRYRESGLDLLDDLRSPGSVRYRAVVRTRSPRRMIEHLAKHGVAAIVPIEDWELLGPASGFPNSAALAHATVSLPCYPSLKNEEQGYVLDVLAEFLHRTD